MLCCLALEIAVSWRRRTKPGVYVLEIQSVCFLVSRLEHVRCNQLNGSHQMRGSEGLSGDLDMTKMEWELLAFDISWELEFCFCGGEGRHFLPSQEPHFCVLGWA